MENKINGIAAAQLHPLAFLRAPSPVTPDLLRSQRKLEMQIFTEIKILSRQQTLKKKITPILNDLF